MEWQRLSPLVNSKNYQHTHLELMLQMTPGMDHSQSQRHSIRRPSHLIWLKVSTFYSFARFLKFSKKGSLIYLKIFKKYISVYARRHVHSRVSTHLQDPQRKIARANIIINCAVAHAKLELHYRKCNSSEGYLSLS